MQYLILIHKSSTATPSNEEWNEFFVAAKASGMFLGGSEIRKCAVMGATPTLESADTIAGFMRFDSDDQEALLEFLQRHPVVKLGGTIEVCEMPRS